MQQTFQDFFVIVVDNGSVDDSAQFVKNHYPNIQLICLLNNDLELDPNLPAFTKTQVIKFYRTDSAGPVTGNLVTDDLWIRAVIQTEEKGAIEAVWKKGEEDTTFQGYVPHHSQ